MTSHKRKQYNPPPRGYRRMWVISYRIDGKWQADGEWFTSREGAEGQVSANGNDYGWQHFVAPVDVPRSVLRGEDVGERRKRGV